MTALGIDIGGTSVKAATVRDEQVLWKQKSAGYDRPRLDLLLAAVAEAVANWSGSVDAIGLCVPGVLDEGRECILTSANIPSLENVPFAKFLAGERELTELRPLVVNDANAAAYDLFCASRPAGRMLVLVIGAGIGASVLDAGRALHVDGDSPGHIGQIDISLDGEERIGPDGGRGGIEAYLGAAALRREYGADPAWKIRAGDPAFRALARTVRIAHALYRPQHVVLAGGVGIRLKRLLPALRDAIESDLTRVARPGWTLTTGDSDFHAAVGAARLAAEDKVKLARQDPAPVAPKCRP